ncbi:YeiH family protein [Aureibacter tunicatorum]|uniref:Integral membrane protein (TIGR00698 family) n=1 Tax=Aureibacter tunicatorum TaxID=866807 RepID=A0AAE3XLC6_9BACT|nr:putative sulfate exporter family transporter [Aureibacter tunicatorum]MDR6240021.1 putative integral membrane protein (TIGR00698 family) [Aureibacter tunicatorum]
MFKIDKNIHTALFTAICILTLTGLVSSPIALLAGFAFTAFLGNPYQGFTKQYSQKLLKISIIGLGFGINLYDAIEIGKSGIVLTVLSIFSTLLIGFILSKIFKLEKATAYLVACGTAICGGSAIAAISPVIKAKEDQTSMALAVVFLLNALALLIFPVLGRFLDMSQETFGLWSAIAIHDTSSVVGASATFGEKALQIATTVKLTRALWIIPISLMSAFLFSDGKSKISIPYFIFGFIAAILLNSFIELPSALTYGVTAISKSMLTLALFFIGANLSIRSLKNVGGKVLLKAVLLWIFISVSSLIFILN